MSRGPGSQLTSLLETGEAPRSGCMEGMDCADLREGRCRQLLGSERRRTSFGVCNSCAMNIGSWVTLFF